MNLITAMLKNIDDKAHQAATSTANTRPLPTEAQAKAGNYKKGRIRVAGLDISIENPVGSSRNPAWPNMTAHYGDIKRTTGNDGDNLDVFVKQGTRHDWDGMIFVIDQKDQHTDKFDEHKCMIGYDTEQSAKRAYLSHFSRGWEKNIIGIRAMSLDTFKEWMIGDLSRPCSKIDLVGVLLKSQARDPDGRFASGNAWAKGLSYDQKRAVREYSGYAHKDLNEALRSGKKLNDHQEEMVSHIDSAIATSPATTKTTTLYRGEDKTAHLYEVGKEVKLNSYTSTSHDKAKAAVFAGQKDGKVLMTIEVPAGTKVANMSSPQVTASAYEHEALLPRGHSIKVTSKHTDSEGVTHIGAKLSGSVGKMSLSSALLKSKSKSKSKQLKLSPAKLYAAHKARMIGALTAFLETQGKEITKQVLKAYGEPVGKMSLSSALFKADPSLVAAGIVSPERLAELISLNGWEDMVDMTVMPELESAFNDAGLWAAAKSIAAGSTVELSSITSLVNKRATKYAAEQSATLVTQIKDSTRNMIRGAVSASLEEGLGSYGLADKLERIFSPERADLIASYELGQAAVSGNMAAWEASGVVKGKRWITAGDAIVSDACSMNAAQGVIPFDQNFQSGSAHPLEHPHCRCDIIAEVK